MIMEQTLNRLYVGGDTVEGGAHYRNCFTK